MPTTDASPITLRPVSAGDEEFLYSVQMNCRYGRLCLTRLTPEPRISPLTSGRFLDRYRKRLRCSPPIK
jgi:hypothetical protein